MEVGKEVVEGAVAPDDDAGLGLAEVIREGLGRGDVNGVDRSPGGSDGEDEGVRCLDRASPA